MILKMDLSTISRKQFIDLQTMMKTHFTLKYNDINADINKYWSYVPDGNAKKEMCQWRDALKYLSENIENILTQDKETVIDLSYMSPMELYYFKNLMYRLYHINNNLRIDISEFFIFDHDDELEFVIMRQSFLAMQKLIQSIMIQFKQI